MLNLNAESANTSLPSSVGADELLLHLGRFPGSVLPIGLMRELQSLGEAIHDPMVRIVRQAIESVNGGVGSEPSSVFFAFALLVPIATKEDQTWIESLLTLPDKSIDHLIGDLTSEAMPRMIANFFKQQSALDAIGWINQTLDHPKLNDLNASPLISGMTIAARLGYLDRDTAIDTLVNRLAKRSEQRSDLQSALVVCELMDLSSSDIEAVDTAVRSCFARGQIDTDYVGLSSWDDTNSHGRYLDDENTWSDPTAALSTWCYDFCSEDLDPVNAKFSTNQRANRSSRLSKSSIPHVIEQLCQSTDDSFPKDVVDSVDVAFADAYEAIIQMIRDELARYDGDTESWSGNGAYLGLVLTISAQMPLPVDLLQSILRLPRVDREKLFGDQFGLIVQAIALTPLHQYDFIEQWVWDGERNNCDRREMVNVYLHACDQGFFDRELAINALTTGLRRALDDEPILIGPYAETLACLTPTRHQPLLEEAFNREDIEWSVELKQLRRMSQDAEFATDEVRQWNRRYRRARTMITDGVMFGPDVYQEKPRYVPLPQPVYQPPAESRRQTALRAEQRTPRNAECPCGSGKKYKKCCLR